MKRITAIALCAVLMCSLFSGCGGTDEKEAYVPTGDALLMEGDDPVAYLGEEERVQEFSLAYNSDRSMNPLIGYSFNNRVLFSLMYQGLFSINNKNTAVPMLCSAYQVSA